MSEISIILPTYNVEKFIARALHSCINQTFKDIEIVVVDDCGSDKSIDIVKEYQAKDKRIKIIYNEKNLGLFRARYEGVKASCGKYSLFLDPDDYLSWDICKVCMENIEDNCILNFGFFYKNQEILPRYKNYNELYCLIKKYTHVPWNIWGNFIRRDFYMEKISPFSNIRVLMAEDLLAFSHLINPNMIALAYVGYFYESHSDSITANKDFKNHIKDYTLIANLLKNSNLDKKIRDYYLYFLHFKINEGLYLSKQISYFQYKFHKILLKLKKTFYRICNNV